MEKKNPVVFDNAKIEEIKDLINEYKISIWDIFAKRGDGMQRLFEIGTARVKVAGMQAEGQATMAAVQQANARIADESKMIMILNAVLNHHEYIQAEQPRLAGWLEDIIRIAKSHLNPPPNFKPDQADGPIFQQFMDFAQVIKDVGIPIVKSKILLQ